MRGETKLKKVAKDVDYEIWMFRETTRGLFVNSGSKLQESILLRNVLLESYAIHVYNLYRFFYQGEVEKSHGKRKRRQDTDVIAEDFGIERRKFRLTRTKKRLLKPLVVKRDKQVAHLTYNRIYQNRITKRWPISKISTMMEQTIKSFLRSLPRGYESFFKSN